MGRRVVAKVIESPSLVLAGAAERPGHPELGLDVGPLCGAPPTGVAVTGDFAEAAKSSKVYIDFTNPEAVLEHLDTAARLGLAAVIGTTGLDVGQKERLADLARSVPVVWAPNMSLGVSLMYKVARLMAERLGPDFDLEIVETHHRLKKDSPSGTAAKLQEVLAEARGLDASASLVCGRQGIIGARPDAEIGVMALRGGDVVGDHTVMFLGTGERLELTHRATSRDVFAAGAIRSAAWIAGKGPGLYSLSDVLGL
jgi:4-hydroxy-tetrahydrodipicolinate reductase